jgi:excisionase family DNA binding protein
MQTGPSPQSATASPKSAPTSPPPPAILATAKEAAGLLRISLAKIYLMMGSGELPYVRFGTHKRAARRIPWEAIQAYVRQHTVTEHKVANVR